MSCTVEVIAYHGWGFDHTCWQPWQDTFRQQGWGFRASDRGYFGTPIRAEFSQPLSEKASPVQKGWRDGPQSFAPLRILLVHSYGLHLCPIAQLRQANLLIIFNSFLDFHPISRPLRRRSQAVLQQMQQHLQTHPESVLSQFKINCYAPLPWLSHCHSLENLDLLRQDLNQLGESRLNLTDHLTDNLTSLNGPSHIMIFHGSQDQIVPPLKGEELAEHLDEVCQWGATRQYFEIADAGHALPFTHFSICWSALRPVIVELCP